MSTLLLCCAVSIGADLSEEERRLISSLPEPERLYVEYALSHGRDQYWGIADGDKIKHGIAMRLLAKYAFLQVVDNSNVIVTLKKDVRTRDGFVEVAGDSFWVSGVDTSKMTDDDEELKVPDDTIFVVAGNRQYETAANAKRTIKHLAAVDMDTASPVLEKLMSARGMRTWTLNGRPARARYESGTNPVTLKTPDGETLRIPRRSLSREELQWLREQIRERRKAQQPPTSSRTTQSPRSLAS